MSTSIGVRLLVAIAVCSLIGQREVVWAHKALLQYKNENYGFAVDLPPGLAAVVDPPPAPQHGFAVGLESGGRIWVDASYDAALTNSPKAFLDGLGEENGAARTVRNETVLHMQGVRLRSIKDGRLHDMLVAFRNRRGEVAVVYTFGLDTDTRHAMRDEARFEAVIVHFKLLPLPV